jgi:hypothetical protein
MNSPSVVRPIPGLGPLCICRRDERGESRCVECHGREVDVVRDGCPQKRRFDAMGAAFAILVLALGGIAVGLLFLLCNLLLNTR